MLTLTGREGESIIINIDGNTIEVNVLNLQPKTFEQTQPRSI